MQSAASALHLAARRPSLLKQHITYNVRKHALRRPNRSPRSFYWAPGGKAQGNVIAKVNTAAINTTYCQPGSDSLSNKNGMLGCTFEPSYGLPGA